MPFLTFKTKVIHARAEAFVEAEVFCESPVTIPACHTHMIFFLKTRHSLESLMHSSISHMLYVSHTLLLNA